MESERQATNVNRKRRKAAPQGDETDSTAGGKKPQRGRPKTGEGDESAADRRRTQIRLAQRAYRQRKETTISTLSKQVSALRETIEEVKRSTTAFADFALSTDMPITHPHVALELNSTLEHIVLICDAAKETGNEHRGSDSEADASGRRSSHDQAQQSLQVSHEENWMNPGLSTMQMPVSSMHQSGHAHRPSVELPLGYLQVFDNPEHDPLAEIEDIDRQALSNQPSSSLAKNIMNKNDHGFPWYTETQFAAFVENPPIYPIVQSNNLAAFANTNFIHYLRQMTVINGFYLLNLENSHPPFVDRCFKLAFVVEPKEVVKAKFGALLHRTPAEMAKRDHSTALIQVGGAGSHFGQYQENTFAIKPGSTSWRARIEKTDNPAISIEIDYDWDDFSGDWFDYSDVEAWLKERGLTYNSNTLMGDAFVEQHEIPADLLSAKSIDDATVFGSAPETAPSPGSLTSSGSTISSDSSPLQSELPVHTTRGVDMGANPLFPTLKPSVDDLTGLAAVANPAVNFLDGVADMSVPKIPATDPVSGVRAPGWTPLGNFYQTFAPSQLPKRKVRVNLDKMVTEMLSGGLCIGRAAAFRRSDVERAFRASIMSVL